MYISFHIVKYNTNSLIGSRKIVNSIFSIIPIRYTFHNGNLEVFHADFQYLMTRTTIEVKLYLSLYYVK